MKPFAFQLLIIFISASFAFGQEKTDLKTESGTPGLSLTKERSILVSKKYLNLPVSMEENRHPMTFLVDGKPVLSFVIRLANAQPDYWVFFDLTTFQGKTLTIQYQGNPQGLNKIYQEELINGQDSLYMESCRPQIHFTSRRGWINDPNGLIYDEGVYHLFYQHNPFESEWENMSWGHAISSDLLHWKELPVVMFPDTLGTIFSGTTVIDDNNTSGFSRNGNSPMVAIYTADGPDKETQCIAYSLDKGYTFTKYEHNPVIDSKARWQSKDLRDPKVFWYSPAHNWVMVLFEQDGCSIYTSPNLREWTYQSHTSGFWECPQLFELKVDGDPTRKKWVMYGASGTYMLGSFNGKTFTPEAGKYYYGNGALYAAQTYENMPPSDNRRIQIAWGRIPQSGKPFNNLMLLPTELTLKTTKDGIRLFNTPVKEIELLQEQEFIFGGNDAEQASEFLARFKDSACLRIKTIIRLSHATDAGLILNGQILLKYDLNFNQINGMFYSPEDPTSMEITADIILDKTSVEVFIDGGSFSYAIGRNSETGNREGFRFFGNQIEIKNLKVYPLKSIWN